MSNKNEAIGVAKEVLSYCGKCKMPLAHVILDMKTESTIGKCQCNTCTHRGGPLCEGTIEGDEVECPWHGAHFSIKTGDVKAPPAMDNVVHYPVQVSGDDIEIEI